MMDSDPESDEETAPRAAPAAARAAPAATSAMPIPTLTPVQDEASPPPSPRRERRRLMEAATQLETEAEHARSEEAALERKLDRIEARLTKLLQYKTNTSHALDAARQISTHKEILANAAREEAMAYSAQTMTKRQRVK